MLNIFIHKSLINPDDFCIRLLVLFIFWIVFFSLTCRFSLPCISCARRLASFVFKRPNSSAYLSFSSVFIIIYQYCSSRSAFAVSTRRTRLSLNSFILSPNLLFSTSFINLLNSLICFFTPLPGLPDTSLHPLSSISTTSFLSAPVYCLTTGLGSTFIFKPKSSVIQLKNLACIESIDAVAFPKSCHSPFSVNGCTILILLIFHFLPLPLTSTLTSIISISFPSPINSYLYSFCLFGILYVDLSTLYPVPFMESRSAFTRYGSFAIISLYSGKSSGT